MKKSKMFGAIALSAVMAMGAVPAFAAPDPATPTEGDSQAVIGNPDNADDNGMVQFKHEAEGDNPTADTMVNVLYNASTIQATVPLQITIVATGEPTKAGEIIAPTNYRIENHSTDVKLQVKSVESALSEGMSPDWDLTTVPTGTTTATNTSKLDLTLTPTKAVVEGTAGKSAALNKTKVTSMDGDAYWQIEPMKEAGTVDANARLDLDLAGNSLVKSGFVDKTEVSNVFTITYVVAAA